ncbi:hypothetical protein [Bordetella petrii]|uniref:hypothetical protein n=1 Tax=Bordetella petrii TaxID=94624 RepID=UPI001E2F25B7|nr:hypothetical protein [Bordetella petrii]MCD0502817.1 hypothetical protein [Bordetella petrii]
MKLRHLLAAMLLQASVVPGLAGAEVGVPELGIALTPASGWSSALKPYGRLTVIALDASEPRIGKYLACKATPRLDPRLRGLTQHEINAQLRTAVTSRDQLTEILASVVERDMQVSVSRNGDTMLGDRFANWFVATMEVHGNGKAGFIHAKTYTFAVPGYMWSFVCMAGMPGHSSRAWALFNQVEPVFDQMAHSIRFSALAPAQPARRVREPGDMPKAPGARPDLSARLDPVPAFVPAAPPESWAAARASQDIQLFSGYGFGVRAPAAADRPILDSTIVQAAMARGCVVRKRARQVIASRNAGPLSVDEVEFPNGCFGTRDVPPLYGVGTVLAPARSLTKYLVFDYDDQARQRLMEYLARQ